MYKLRRVVCSTEEQHIVLQTGRDNNIDVIADTNMFFIVSVASKIPPGKIQILYAPGSFVKQIGGEDKWRRRAKKERGKPVDLKVCYGGSHIKEPVEGNCLRT